MRKRKKNKVANEVEQICENSHSKVLEAIRTEKYPIKMAYREWWLINYYSELHQLKINKSSDALKKQEIVLTVQENVKEFLKIYQ